MSDNIEEILHRQAKALHDRRVQNAALKEQVKAESLAIDRDLADVRAAFRAMGVPWPNSPKGSIGER